MPTWKSLPAKFGRPASPQTGAHLPKTHPPLLIVDDESGIREAICLLFADTDHPLLEASNGEEALRIMRESPERLIILLDNVMPVLDGEGVLRAVLQDRHLRHSHAIIFVTAMARLSRRLSLQRLLLDLSIEAIAKPFNLTDLEQAVERARAKLER